MSTWTIGLPQPRERLVSVVRKGIVVRRVRKDRWDRKDPQARMGKMAAMRPSLSSHPR